MEEKFLKNKTGSVCFFNLQNKVKNVIDLGEYSTRVNLLLLNNNLDYLAVYINEKILLIDIMSKKKIYEFDNKLKYFSLVLINPKTFLLKQSFTIKLYELRNNEIKFKEEKASKEEIYYIGKYSGNKLIIKEKDFKTLVIYG